MERVVAIAGNVQVLLCSSGKYLMQLNLNTKVQYCTNAQ